MTVAEIVVLSLIFAFFGYLIVDALAARSESHLNDKDRLPDPEEEKRLWE